VNPRVVTFGEILLRLSPPGHLRLGEAHSFDVFYAGGEANVAVSLVHFGLASVLISRVPAGAMGDAALQFLQGHGLNTEAILRGGERLGIYFLEHGAAQRGSQVVYDRSGSSFATLQPGEIDWKRAMSGASWFHWTGITPAVAPGPAALCLEAVKTARELGLTVSCDLNYRAKLWKWGKPASVVMAELVGQSDVVMANEEDAEKVFGIQVPGVDVTTGRVEAVRYREVCEQLAAHFPSLHTVAITLRGSLSADHNTWSGALWQEGKYFIGPTYDIADIVDRVGTGDSFAAGLIYGLNRFNTDPQRVLNFAVAASALKHSIFGDFNQVSLEEVEALMIGNASGRVKR
jgi:2-dehydro-3-deoxygluconokinase